MYGTIYSTLGAQIEKSSRIQRFRIVGDAIVGLTLFFPGPYDPLPVHKRGTPRERERKRKKEKERERDKEIERKSKRAAGERERERKERERDREVSR
jgi:hypothetical protein